MPRAARIDALLADGPIQVVVNNAGIHDDAPMAGMTDAQWKRVIDVSLHGFFHVTQPLLLPMARTRWGRIVSISSVAAVLGNRGQANYAAAKAALHGASKSLAREMASRGITVNVVAPGVIEGSMAGDAFPAEADQADRARRPRRHAGGGRRAGGVPVLGRGRLHQRAGDRHQRRHGLTTPLNPSAAPPAVGPQSPGADAPGVASRARPLPRRRPCPASSSPRCWP